MTYGGRWRCARKQKRRTNNISVVKAITSALDDYQLCKRSVGLCVLYMQMYVNVFKLCQIQIIQILAETICPAYRIYSAHLHSGSLEDNKITPNLTPNLIFFSSEPMCCASRLLRSSTNINPPPQIHTLCCTCIYRSR